MNNFFKNVLTARDNISFSLTKLVGISAAVAMVVNFIRLGSVDFDGFGVGMAALMAALAAKYFVEDKGPE